VERVRNDDDDDDDIVIIVIIEFISHHMVANSEALAAGRFSESLSE